MADSDDNVLVDYALPEPTEKAVAARRKRRTPRIGTVTREDGTEDYRMDRSGADAGQALMEAFGTEDMCFTGGLLIQLSKIRGETTDPEGFNLLLSTVECIKPRDEVEAMLAAQMAVTHSAIMQMGQRLVNHTDLERVMACNNAYNKLSRTYAAQVEALRKYRTGGQQHVRVEHVTVNEGGQAIVGNVATGGRGNSKKTRSPS